MSAQNLALVQRMFAAFNSGDLGDVEAFIGEDYVNYEALDDDDERSRLHGADEFRATVGWMRGVFAELRFEVQETVDEGERIAAYVIMTGKQIGDFMDIPPTNKTVTVKQMHLFHLKGGKIVSHRAVRDDLGLMLQLGAIRFGSSA